MRGCTTLGNVKTYLYEGQKITSGSHFLYEIDLYRISKNRANIISTRYFRSNKLLKIEEVKVIRYFKGFTIERYSTLLEVPEYFIKENNLTEYIKPIKKRKKHEREKN